MIWRAPAHGVQRASVRDEPIREVLPRSLLVGRHDLEFGAAVLGARAQCRDREVQLVAVLPGSLVGLEGHACARHAPGRGERVLAATQSTKYRAIFMLAYGAGLRIGAVCALHVGDMGMTERRSSS